MRPRRHSRHGSNSIADFVSRFWSHGEGSRRAKARKPKALRLEQLESRLAMAVVVNEVLASSSGNYIQDEDGDDSDYIELYNAGESTQNLGGWYLTDDEDELTKWQLPSIDLEPGEYLVVFASNKDRAVAGSELHTNFALSAGGEYVALVQPDGTTIESGFEFPAQFVDASYGWADLDGGGQGLRYFVTPTPGQANGEGVVGFVDAVELSHEHGFYEDAFELELATETDGAQIYFTYDGSIPSPENASAQLYTDEIVIDRTTIVRVAAHKEGLGSSAVKTQTYVFLQDVLTQTIDRTNPANNPFGLSYASSWGGVAGDYNMDPAVVAAWNDDNPENDDFGIRQSLLSLPSMSIVMDQDDIFGQTNGIYPNALREGDDWRRAGSIEYFDPNGGEGFQYNVGVQIHGRGSRSPDQPKHSFRLIFNPEFGGPGRLNFPLFDQSNFADINTVVLKGMNQDNFAVKTVIDQFSSVTATNMRDQWMQDTFRAMGNTSAQFTYVHLYVNGLYWGLYQAVERMDDASVSSHLGGEPEDWDIIRPDGEYTGELDAWNQMFDLARSIPSGQPATANAIYYRLQGLNPDGTRNEEYPVLLDMDNLIDYLMLHYFAGANEWTGQFVAARNRLEPDTGFKFFVWDQDVVLNYTFGGRIETFATGTYSAQELKGKLFRSPEFQMRFADRAQMHLYNGGALSVEQTAARVAYLAQQIEASIVADSARWGDNKAGKQVTLRTGQPKITLPTVTIDTWRNAVDKITAYMASSNGILPGLLNTYGGLFPTLKAPLINQFGGDVEEGFEVTLSKPDGSPGSAVIYYTLNGTDPRLAGGGLRAGAIAYSGPLTLENDARILARIRSGSTWSPLIDTSFDVAAPIERIPGDYDGNWEIDEQDYKAWRSSYGKVITPNTEADGNGDGVVDGADYTVWRNAYERAKGPDYKFYVIGQTYTQNFNNFRGTEETLPNYFSVTVDEGNDPFRDTFNFTSHSASSFTGIKAATSDGSDYSFAWRENTGSAGLVDTRVLFTFTNLTDEPITGFNVSYDVEAWVNGRRDNRVRFKYDVYPNSDAAQAAEARDAFATDIFATDNPNHTIIDDNNQQFKLDGKAAGNRATVSGYVDLATLLKNETDPGLGVFGALMPGETGYFRWQISNGSYDEGGNRSALGIDNISIAALAAAPAGGGGGLAGAAPSVASAPLSISSFDSAASIQGDALAAAFAELAPNGGAGGLAGRGVSARVSAHATASNNDLLLIAASRTAADDAESDPPLQDGAAPATSEELDELFAAFEAHPTLAAMF